MPGILGTFSVLFANALAAYATVYALMMNISLLPIQIAGSFVGEVKLKPGLGGALSVVMMAMMVIMIFVTNGISRQFQKGVKKVEKEQKRFCSNYAGADRIPPSASDCDDRLFSF